MAFGVCCKCRLTRRGGEKNRVRFNGFPDFIPVRTIRAVACEVNIEHPRQVVKYLFGGVFQGHDERR